MIHSVPGRRRWGAALAVALLAAGATAHEIPVPPRLQAALTARTAPFDLGLAARSKRTVLVLVVYKAANAESDRVAGEYADALQLEGTIGEKPVDVQTLEVASAQDLPATIRSRRPAIVYLAAGFADEMPALAAALAGQDVLTVAAEPAAVTKGACLGFNLLAGRPRLVINVRQAKKQGVHFDASLLRLASVVEQ